MGLGISETFADLVGHTPLFRLTSYLRAAGVPEGAQVLAKLEYFNPAGSVKDRIALEMILDAEKKGVLKKGGTIIEPTSGNTGIGLAAVAASRGYKVILTLPESMSIERQKLLRAYGAELELTSAQKGMKGSIERAEELRRSLPGSVILGQFENDANPEAHKKTTGPELWEQSGGKIDVLVAGVGTGGTLTGTGEFLKSKNPELTVVAVEPAGSPVLSEGRAGAHRIQGIGAGFVPSVLDTELYDEVIKVSDEDAFLQARSLARTEGILVGISSGAALHAAQLIARRPQNKNKVIAVVLPDGGDRYLSTTLFTD